MTVSYDHPTKCFTIFCDEAEIDVTKSSGILEMCGEKTCWWDVEQLISDRRHITQEEFGTLSMIHPEFIEEMNLVKNTFESCANLFKQEEYDLREGYEW